MLRFQFPDSFTSILRKQNATLSKNEKSLAALWTVRHSRSRCARFRSLAEVFTRKTFSTLRQMPEGLMKRIFRTGHGLHFARLREVARIRRRVCALDRRAKGANRMNRPATALIDALVNAIAAMDVAANFIYRRNAPSALKPLQ